ncbi:hypothetical protein Pelo_1094 [Pelomyxa schiedti]|nr:hypothetical protein Pelo_1094 [Pelomyxa schiedti]
MVASANLPNAGHTNQSHWIWGGNTDICWFADTGGVLYVVYAPPPPDEGNIHISLVDPGTLALQQTWVVPRVKKQTGFAFAVSGRFYFGSPNGNSLQQIDGVFDTATNEYDGSYRNALPTTSPGSIIYLTSWLPATNQLLVVFLDSGMYQTLLLDNAAVVEQHS